MLTEPHLIKGMYIDTHSLIRSGSGAEIDWGQLFHTYLNLWMLRRRQIVKRVWFPSVLFARSLWCKHQLNILSVSVQKSSISIFHKWRSQVDLEQVPSNLVIEVYLYSINYDMKDWRSGKLTPGKQCSFGSGMAPSGKQMPKVCYFLPRNVVWVLVLRFWDALYFACGCQLSQKMGSDSWTWGRGFLAKS